jgi:purine nucleosidase
VYILGDSPLVTLTALMSPWTPDPSSSLYVTRPCPNISDRGEYVPRPEGRPIRVYTQIDARLTFEDLYSKLRHALPPTKRG